MTAPDITVAVCTRDRARSLESTLDSLARMRTAGMRWELLVIDNGSSDDTAATIATFAGRLPVRTVSEPDAGLARARNRAVAEAGGAWIVWTDDDVLVDEQWLEAYSRAFAADREATCFGGPIRPAFEPPPPEWLRRTLHRVGAVWSLLDHGPGDVPLGLEPYRVPFGANYAVRNDAQRRYPYDPRWGRQPSRPSLVGEDVAVLEAMLRDGHRGRWVPGAGVRHRIGAERQTLDYLRAQLRGYGAFRAARAERSPPAGAIAAFRWRAAALSARWRLRRALRLAPERWIEDLVRAEDALGWLEGHRRASGS